MEIARLFGTLGFKFDPKGIDSFQKSLLGAKREMMNLSRSIRNEVQKINAELASLKGKMNFQGGTIGGTRNFQHLKDAITQTKIALDGLSGRSSVYSSSIDRINQSARAGVPMWAAYRSEVVSVQRALQSLHGTMNNVNSASRITVNARGGATGPAGANAGGLGGLGGNNQNGALALMLGGLSGGGLFNTAKTAIVAGLSNAAVFGTGALIKNVIDRGRELRASEQVLMANTKDMNEYNYLNDWLNKLSDRLGTNLIESQKAFGSIMMSARAGGGNLEQSQKVFTAFSEYSTTMHLSQETQERLLRAVQQTYTIQKIHGQELNQFANAGLNMKALLVDAVKQAYGVDDKTARKMATSGQAETVKVMPIIADKLSKIVRNNDALGRAMNSSQAEQGRFSNAFTKFSGNVMENGGDEALAKFFRTLTHVVEWTNKFYDNMVGLNKLFNDISGGHSSWIWFLNLLIIMLSRGAFGIRAFTGAGRAAIPMFLGVSRAVIGAVGVLGYLRILIGSPFMKALLAFGKRWFWIITLFQMVMTLGKTMNERMMGYTTWFDLWVGYIKYLMVWFDVLQMKAELAMRKVAISMHLSEPDYNPDGTKNNEMTWFDRTSNKLLPSSWKDLFLGKRGTFIDSLNPLNKATANAPDPAKVAKQNRMTDLEAAKQQNLQNQRDLEVIVKLEDRTRGGVEATHVKSRTGTGAN